MSQPGDYEFRDLEFAKSIATDMIPVLEERHFFELLDDLYCPPDPTASARKCEHSYSGSIEILETLGMDSREISDVLAALKARGGCCDCEILYNAVEESRLKGTYWKAHYIELAKERGF